VDDWPRSPQAGSEVYQSVVIALVPRDWDRRDGGMYVGRGNKAAGLPAFHLWARWSEKPDSRVGWPEPTDGFSMFVSKPLYVSDTADFAFARVLVDYYRLSYPPAPQMNLEGWTETFRRTISRGGNACQVGVALNFLLLQRPGLFGDFCRFQASGFARDLGISSELLPLDFAGICPEATMLWPQPSQDYLQLPEEQRQEILHTAGIQCWKWLVVAALNYMYCGMEHCSYYHIKGKVVRSAGQQLAMDKIDEAVRRFLFADGTPRSMRVGNPVEGDMAWAYWGAEVQVALPLTLQGVLPSLPAAGVAGSVDILSLVSDQTRALLQDPSLLRLDEAEVEDPLPTAKVIVASQNDYEDVVRALWERGMCEPEDVPNTVRHKGRPVRNGLMGVHKKWVKGSDGEELQVLRLIINLVPTNALQRPMRGASQRMGYPMLLSSIVLHGNESLVFYSEDQASCFHMYLVPEAWRNFFVIDREVPGPCLGLPEGTRARPRIRTVPMGWVQAVDIIQEAFEFLNFQEPPQGAGLRSDAFFRMGSPSPNLSGSNRDWFQLYVDNWDQGKVVLTTEMHQYTFKPSGEQIAVREAFLHHGVRRDPEKAAEGVVQWETLGASLDGEAGLIGTSSERRLAVAGEVLHIIGDSNKPMMARRIQTALGKLNFCMQFQNSLISMFGRIYVEVQSPFRLTLSLASTDELLVALCLLPMMFVSIRTPVSGVVVATDASETGGGACISKGLSPLGRQRARDLMANPDGNLLHEPNDEPGAADDRPSVLIISVFSGMEGAGQAAKLGNAKVAGIISIDNDKVARRVARDHHPQGVQFHDIQLVDDAMVANWRRWHPDATEVTFMAGFPCQDVSGINVGRAGATGSRTGLLGEALRVERLVSLRKHNWVVRSLYECVASMDDADERYCSDLIGVQPWFADASEVSPCSRPRYYWLRSITVAEMSDVWFHGGGVHFKLGDTDVPNLSHFLEPGASKAIDDGGIFFCFLRPHARSSPPPHPAGLQRASPPAIRRWKGDSYRLAPYQYSQKNLIRDQFGLRRLAAEESLRMLAFNSGHLDGVGKVVGKKMEEDTKGQLVGNSFSCIVIARLLLGVWNPQVGKRRSSGIAYLWQRWLELEDKAKEAKARSKSWSSQWSSTPSSSSNRAAQHSTGVGQEQAQLAQALVEQYIRHADHRGSDVRMDVGIIHRSGSVQRMPVATALWEWKAVLSYAWIHPGAHINVLELAAVFDYMRSACRQSDQLFIRQLFILDSQVGLAVLAKGRSSSVALNALLRRVAALRVASGRMHYYAWCKSADNPADGPSQWKLKHA